MTGPVLVILLVLMAAAVGVVLLLRAGRERERTEARLEHPATETIEYAVPLGQDPAVVLAALEHEGITATVDPSTERQLVHIECPSDDARARERIREVLQSSTGSTAIDHGAPVNVGHVRFEDE